MRRNRPTPPAAILLLAACASLPACGRGDAAKAAKAEAKKARDAQLLAMSYPASRGAPPAGMELRYDAATDRTTISLRLAGLAVGGGGAASVSSATLVVVSSHRGRTRPTDNPEGAVDGSLIVSASTPGVLAFSGPPGTLAAAGRTTPLKGPSDGAAYASTAEGGRWEETVRFRIPTEDLVGAVQSGSASITVGTLRVDLAGAPLADLREFAARLNPRP